jgi:hypothetical protein
VCRCAGPPQPGAPQLGRLGRHQRARLPRRTRRCRMRRQPGVRRLAPQQQIPPGIRWWHRPRWDQRYRPQWARHWSAGSPAGRLPGPIPARRPNLNHPLHRSRRLGCRGCGLASRRGARETSHRGDDCDGAAPPAASRAAGTRRGGCTRAPQYAGSQRRVDTWQARQLPTGRPRRSPGPRERRPQPWWLATEAARW